MKSGGSLFLGTPVVEPRSTCCAANDDSPRLLAAASVLAVGRASKQASSKQAASKEASNRAYETGRSVVSRQRRKKPPIGPRFAPGARRAAQIWAPRAERKGNIPFRISSNEPLHAHNDRATPFRKESEEHVYSGGMLSKRWP